LILLDFFILARAVLDVLRDTVVAGVSTQMLADRVAN
jgi:hypothetical protein